MVGPARAAPVIPRARSAVIIIVSFFIFNLPLFKSEWPAV
jgi:hypothetical protein